MTTLATHSTAVLVIDMQNDNLHADGAFASTGAADHAASQNVVHNVRSVLDAARTVGAPVFHNRIVARPERAVGGSNAPIFTMIGPESLKDGSWGAEIIEGLDPRADEIILDRIRMSAFNGTSLDIMLRNLGITDWGPLNQRHRFSVIISRVMWATRNTVAMGERARVTRRPVRHPHRHRYCPSRWRTSRRSQLLAGCRVRTDLSGVRWCCS